MSRHRLQDLIARTIQKSDRSIFFENYNKQARAVITELHKAGWIIVPEKPSDKILQEATLILREGRHRPRDIITAIYRKFTESI